MCEIKDVQAIYSFMKIKGIGVMRTNKALLSYTEQLGSMWKLEDWLLSVLTANQRTEYYSHYEQVDGLRIKMLEVLFCTVLDQNYPMMLKSLLKLNTPPVLSMIKNVSKKYHTLNVFNIHFIHSIVRLFLRISQRLLLKF